MPPSLRQVNPEGTSAVDGEGQTSAPVERARARRTPAGLGPAYSAPREETHMASRLQRGRRKRKRIAKSRDRRKVQPGLYKNLLAKGSASERKVRERRVKSPVDQLGLGVSVRIDPSGERTGAIPEALENLVGTEGRTGTERLDFILLRHVVIEAELDRVRLEERRIVRGVPEDEGATRIDLSWRNRAVPAGRKNAR